MTPQERATRAAQSLLARDAHTAAMGLKMVTAEPGKAVVQMTVAPAHLNGHDICHGGVIFTLADTAFALACNSFNQRSVAQQNQITYLAPAQRDEILVATAIVTATQGRSGITDVTVTGQEGRMIALMRGLSRSLGQPLFEEPED